MVGVGSFLSEIAWFRQAREATVYGTLVFAIGKLRFQREGQTLW